MCLLGSLAGMQKEADLCWRFGGGAAALHLSAAHTSSRPALLLTCISQHWLNTNLLSHSSEQETSPLTLNHFPSSIGDFCCDEKTLICGSSTGFCWMCQNDKIFLDNCATLKITLLSLWCILRLGIKIYIKNFYRRVKMSDRPSKSDIQQVFKRLRSAAANKVSQITWLMWKHQENMWN